MELDLIGKWAFLVGLAVIIIGGILEVVDPKIIALSTVMLIVFILGLIVGLINIDKKKVTEFLVSIIALIMVTSVSIAALSIKQLSEVTPYIQSILTNFLVFAAGAALVVSIKAIIVIAKK